MTQSLSATVMRFWKFRWRHPILEIEKIDIKFLIVYPFIKDL